MNRRKFFEKVIAFITSFVFVASVAGASVALAALTFSGVAVTTDSFLSLLGGLVGMGGNATSSSMLYVQSQGVGTSTVYFQGLAGQTANLLTIASSTGANLFTIDPVGNVSTTGNVTIGGSFQSNAGQSTFGAVSSTNFSASGFIQGGTVNVTTVSSTNLFASGYVSAANVSSSGNITGVNIQATTGANLGAVSSTNFSASGFINASTSNISNQSSTNLSVVGFINASTSNISNQSSTNLSVVGFINASTSNISNQSSTNISVVGFIQGGTVNVTTVSSTNLFASGYVSAANVSSSGNITGVNIQATTGANLGAVSSTKLSVGSTGVPFNLFAAYSTNVTVGAIASLATGTIGFTGVTTISTTTRQSWLWGGFSTSSGLTAQLQVVAIVPSSTVNAVDVIVLKTGTGNFPATTGVTSTIVIVGF